MSMASLEKEILFELQSVTKNNKLKKKDIMEWRTSELQPHEGEEVIYLPELRIWCAIKKIKVKNE